MNWFLRRNHLHPFSVCNDNSLKMWINLISWQSLLVPFKKKQKTFYSAFIFLWRAKLNYFDAKVTRRAYLLKCKLGMLFYSYSWAHSNQAFWVLDWLPQTPPYLHKLWDCHSHLHCAVEFFSVCILIRLVQKCINFSSNQRLT